MTTIEYVLVALVLALTGLAPDPTAGTEAPVLIASSDGPSTEAREPAGHEKPEPAASPPAPAAPVRPLDDRPGLSTSASITVRIDPVPAGEVATPGQSASAPAPAPAESAASEPQPKALVPIPPPSPSPRASEEPATPSPPPARPAEPVRAAASPSPSGGLDGRFQGSWEAQFRSDTGAWVWRWHIAASGAYLWSSAGPIPLPPESGTMRARAGRFKRVSAEGRVDEGTYEFGPDGTLKLVTSSWTQVWKPAAR